MGDHLAGWRVKGIGVGCNAAKANGSDYEKLKSNNTYSMFSSSNNKPLRRKEIIRSQRLPRSNGR